MKRGFATQTRRHFCRRLCLLLGASLLAAASPAQTPDAPETDYETAVRLLKTGRNYNEAITALERATQASPQNAIYHAVLGCAYAARFASVCAALRYIPEVSSKYERYVSAKKRWDKAQTDPQNADYGTPAPSPPPAPLTPDDGVSIALVHRSGISDYGAEYMETKPAPDVMADLQTLYQKSREAFEISHRLAQSLPGEAQAAVENLRGWGLFLLWQSATHDTSVQKAVFPVSPKPPTDEETLLKSVRAAFFSCVARNETNPDYWHALALCSVPPYKIAETREEADADIALHSKEANAARAAFDRALALKPNDAVLLLQSAFLLNRTLSYPDYTARLEQAARKIRSAVLWQLVAIGHFFHAEKQAPDSMEERAAWAKGFADVGKANRSTNFETPVLSAPVPLVLRAAWALFPLDGLPDEGEMLSNLDVYLTTYIDFHLKALGGSKQASHGAERAVLAGIAAQETSGTSAVQNVLTLPSRTNREQRSDLHDRLLEGERLWDKAIENVKKLQAVRPSDYKARLLREMTEARNKARHDAGAWRAKKPF